MPDLHPRVPLAERPHRRRILCAEDDRQVGPMLLRLLTGAGHEVCLAENGSVALSRITERPDYFDLLITDNHMPELDGLFLVTQAKLAGFQGQIIVFSGALKQTEREDYQRNGVSAFVEKGEGAGPILEIVAAGGRRDGADLVP